MFWSFKNCNDELPGYQFIEKDSPSSVRKWLTLLFISCLHTDREWQRVEGVVLQMGRMVQRTAERPNNAK